MATWNDPSPLANPFSQRAYGNFNINRANRGGYIRQCRNPASLAVPNQDIPLNGSPKWYDMMNSNNLTVPNQDIPPGDSLNNFGNPGFINDRLFRLPDGTIMDYKTGRVIRNGSDNMDRCISPEDVGFENSRNWNSRNRPSLDELINHTERYAGTATPDGYIEQMDPRSAAYWLKANTEAEKLKASMTDEQKRLIAAFEAHFPKSKLIEESQKIPSGKIV